MHYIAYLYILPSPSDWLTMYDWTSGAQKYSHLASLSITPNLLFDVATFAPLEEGANPMLFKNTLIRP